MNTIAVTSNVYDKALAYAKRQNKTVDEIVEHYLSTLVVVEPPRRKLPDSFRKLKGILAGVDDPKDERLNHILSK